MLCFFDLVRFTGINFGGHVDLIIVTLLFINRLCSGNGEGITDGVPVTDPAYVEQTKSFRKSRATRNLANSRHLGISS